MPAPAVSFYSRVFALAVAAILGYALFLIFRPFALPLVWAAFLAFLLHPVNRALRRRFHGKELAAALLTVAAPLVVMLPFSLLSVQFVVQISVLIRKWQESAAQLDIKSFSDLEQFPVIARANSWLQDHADVSAEQIQAWVVGATRDLMQHAAGIGGTLFVGALGSIFAIAIMLFMLYFFLRDGDGLIVRAQRLIPMDEERKQRLFHQLSTVTRAIVFGTSMTALMQGALVGIGFAIAGLPSPVVFGVLAALLALLPVGGAAIVWVPGVLWLLAEKHWGMGIFLFVWGAILSSVDHFVRPMLISGRAPISAMAVFIGVLGGIPAFGAIGIVLGPVIISLVLALLEFAEESRPKNA